MEQGGPCLSVTTMAPGPVIRFVLKCGAADDCTSRELCAGLLVTLGFPHLPLQAAWHQHPILWGVVVLCSPPSRNTHLLCLPEVQAEGPRKA